MEKWESPIDIINDPPCWTCLKSALTNYLELLDMHKLLEGRKKMLQTGKTVIVSLPMPMILGAKGYVNYVFHGEDSEVLIDKFSEG